MSTIFFLGGLGLDNSIINDLTIEGYRLQFVDWERPDPKDTFGSYSDKIISKYKIEKDSIVIGVSFGGLMALEISKKINLKKIILISSLENCKELPFLFRLILWLHLYTLFPPSILKHLTFILKYFFSISNSADAQVLKRVIEITDPIFLKWALKEVMAFKSPNQVPNISRIHGDKDRIIPLNKNLTNSIISDGGHFMIYDKKRILTLVITNLLKKE